MSAFGVIVVAAGSSRRMGGGRPKVVRALEGRPVLEHSLRTLARCPALRAVVVATSDELLDEVRELVQRSLPEGAGQVVRGGAERRDSVAAALAAMPAEVEVVLVHDAARPRASVELFEAVAAAAAEHGAAVPCIPLADTVKREAADGALSTVPRRELRAVQTPQGFRRSLLEEAHAAPLSEEATDDAMMVEALGHRVVAVDGDRRNRKLTHPEDFAWMELESSGVLDEGGRETSRARGAGMSVRVGLGRDLHRLEPGGPLRLGGIDVPGELQAVGHSDGDALLHALTDAILGALALGDIGRHFSDLDPANEGIDSALMLQHAVKLARDRGHRPQQVDAVISLQRPKLAPHAEAMRARVAEILGLPVEEVSVKAKTGEGLGPIGEGRAIEVEAVATLIPV